MSKISYLFVTKNSSNYIFTAKSIKNEIQRKLPCSFDVLDADFSSYALFLYNICGAWPPDPEDGAEVDDDPPAEVPPKRSAAANAALVAAMVGVMRS